MSIRSKIFCSIFLLALAACQKQTESQQVATNSASVATTRAQTASASTSAVSASQVATQQKKRIWVQYPDPNTPLSPEASLGKQLFFDATLSASGKMSCATCHEPDHAYAPSNNLAVQLGGSDMQQPGTRAVPSLRYLAFTPKFTRHFYRPSSEGVEDEGPTGGFTHDGAVDSLSLQAAIPILAANEMANLTAGGFTERLRQSPSAAAFIKLFGADMLQRPEQALERAGAALEAFQMEDYSFHPYTSKYDAAVSGETQLSDAEMRGFIVFNDVRKGNCAKCHTNQIGPGGRPAQFTDFEFEAIGAPRNAEIPANKNPAYFDLGICGPARKDLIKETNYCGMFKTPTLRNVATRQVFLHNGVFKSLDDVIHFYAERDSKPEKWFPKSHGKTELYNDLPKKYRENVDHITAPFNRKKTDGPVMTEAEMQDLLAFLKTLDDGYRKVGH
ncbi:cytochrome-c peroxidase [Undibacterium jejuense]|uniref:Cytochrome-c peroxidase n=1 Tax=Undibacterium jejuense TaxID=1344949 RepID=A0A923HKU1_9BURK|nr:cytochrome c peroxidase [Undibacterium jejuense]MBC3863537.1 cytochrome-c peroxidase [Undibacterium jejuense]